jgi:protease IV
MQYKKITVRLYFLFLVLIFSNCFSFNTFKLFDIPQKGIELTEHLIMGSAKEKFLIISIDGIISDRSSADSFGFNPKESMVSRIKEELNKAYNDPDVKGLLLKINSPGGGVTSSDIIYKEIKSFKNSKKIPIIVLFMDTAASGGYYIAMAGDKIIAHPTSITGSIGVIISGINVKKGLDKLGIEDQSITSGPNKAILSPLIELKPEQREIIQEIVNEMYSRFFQIVSENRKQIPIDKLKGLADGRIYTSNQALKVGLIDKIGYFNDSIELLKQEFKNNGGYEINDPRVVAYSVFKKPIKNIYQLEEIGLQEKSTLRTILDSIESDKEVKFMYLWTY